MTQILSILLLATLTGCGSLVKETPVVLRPAQTNVVAVVVTNWITTNLPNVGTLTTAGNPLVVPTPAISITPTVSRGVVLTNYVTNVVDAVTVTNLGLNTAYTATAQAVANAAPVPWLGGAVQLLIAVAGVGFGWWNRRNAAKALGKAQTWEDTANVLVDNVETIRTAAKALPAYTQEVDDKVMKGVMMAQQAAGVAHTIYDVVQSKKETTTTPTL